MKAFDVHVPAHRRVARPRAPRRGTFALAYAAAVGTAVAAFAAIMPVLEGDERKEVYHELPFAFTTRQPIVPVSVNGGPLVPFVVDTGASIHLVDITLAPRAGVAGGTSTRLSGGGQARAEVTFLDALTLQAGGLVWDGQRAAVTALGYPKAKHFGGLLGAPVLMRYTVQFDFDAHTMRLYDPSRYAPPAGAVIVPFELQENLPIVRVTVDAGSGPLEARLMVDTGAGTFIDLNRPFVDAHRLVESIPDAASKDRPAAIGGTAPFLYGTGHRVTFGGTTFDRPRLGLSRAQSGSSSRHDRDGVIGNDLLRHFLVTFDYRRSALVLERQTARR
jgi:hypothetical protein